MNLKNGVLGFDAFFQVFLHIGAKKAENCDYLAKNGRP